MEKHGALIAELEAQLVVVEKEQKAHAVYSASGAERWLNCPGSINLSAKAPPEAESKYAAEGTKAHACLEFLLKNRKHPWLGVVYDVALKHFGDEMFQHAADAVEYLEGRLLEMPGAELLCEQKVDASAFTMTGQFGTLDAAIVEPFGRLVIVDYKYGAGHAVDTGGHDGRGNPQLVYYALALSHQYDHNFADVELVVIQPRAFHESGETTRSTVMTMEALLAWHQTFRDGVMESGPDSAPLKPGKWCKFCRAGVICTKLKGDAFKEAQIIFSDETGVVEAVPEPRMITLPNLGTILDGCDKLEAWIEKVRQHAYGVLERGHAVPGYKLVQKQARRKWTMAAEGALKRKLGAVAFSPPKLLAPGKLETTFKAGGIWDDGVAELVKQHTTKESSGTVVVRADDKRPAVVSRSAESIFSVVEKNVTPETKRKRKNG